VISPYLVSPDAYLDARMVGWKAWEEMGLVRYHQRIVMVCSEPVMLAIREVLDAR
jgi:hypothetical protein